MNIVFLPAVSPGDISYGTPREDWPLIEEQSGGTQCAMVQFDRLVWYNSSVRRDTMSQIEEICDGAFGDVLLIGFSKSGCGAMNLVFAHPGLFRGVIVFDAPLINEDARRFEKMPEFYADDAALRPDIPLLRLRNGAESGDTKVLLVSGENFGAEMATFADAWGDQSGPLTVIDDTPYPHHWNSGWLLRALETLVGARAGSGC